MTASTPRLRIPFFDTIKLQLTKSDPKLTHINHQIDYLNSILGTNFRNWNSKDIYTLDVILGKDLTRYFKFDLSAIFSSGALKASGTAFRRTLHLNGRLRKHYDVLSCWATLYLYPLSCNFKNRRPDRLIDPFVAAGVGYTFLRQETALKLRRDTFKSKLIANYGDHTAGLKLMAGFDLHFKKFSPALERFGITGTVTQMWTRMSGHANARLTGRRHNIVRKREHMDIDLTGLSLSLAVFYRF